MNCESANLNKDKKLWERKSVVSNYDDDAFKKLEYQHVINTYCHKEGKFNRRKKLRS